jgi:hypothetical protein
MDVIQGLHRRQKMGQVEYYKALINNLIDNLYFSRPEARIRVSLSASSV